MRKLRCYRHVAAELFVCRLYIMIRSLVELLRITGGALRTTESEWYCAGYAGAHNASPVSSITAEFVTKGRCGSGRARNAFVLLSW